MSKTGPGGNRFAAFTPAPEVGSAPVQQKAPAAPKPSQLKEAKKITIKPKKDMPKVDDGQGEFADVSEKPQVQRNRANPRDNRYKGGEDGEGRGRGGEGRGRGGGRGRGDGERRGRGDGGARRRDEAQKDTVDADGNP